MAHGISPASRKKGAYGEHQLGVALDVLADYCDFNSYNVWIPATALTDATAVSPVSVSTTPFEPTRVLPDGKNSVLAATFRRPRQWVNGRVAARMWWTGVDAADSFFYGKLYVEKASEDGNFSSGTNTDVQVSLGTFTSDTLQIVRDFDLVGALSVSPVDHLLRVSLKRTASNANDTYNNDMYLIGVEVFYTEFASQAGYRINPDYKSVSMP